MCSWEIRAVKGILPVVFICDLEGCVIWEDITLGTVANLVAVILSEKY